MYPVSPFHAILYLSLNIKYNMKILKQKDNLSLCRFTVGKCVYVLYVCVLSSWFISKWRALNLSSSAAVPPSSVLLLHAHSPPLSFLFLSLPLFAHPSIRHSSTLICLLSLYVRCASFLSHSPLSALFTLLILFSYLSALSSAFCPHIILLFSSIIRSLLCSPIASRSQSHLFVFRVILMFQKGVTGVAFCFWWWSASSLETSAKQLNENEFPASSKNAVLWR